MKTAAVIALIAAAVGVGGMPAAFVDVTDVVPGISIEMAYAGDRNFVGRRVHGYGAARCLLTKQAAAALGKVQKDLVPFGVGLRVYDCYRPKRAVADFLDWAQGPDDPMAKARQYPAEHKEELFKHGYIATKSAHSRGSTVDLTLVPLPLPTAAGARDDERGSTGQGGGDDPPCTDPGPGALAPDGSLNMGTTFDCFDDMARAASTAVPPEARRNRLLLRMAMTKQGFVPYEKEWWHFTLGAEPFPKEGFDFEIAPPGATQP